MDSLADFDSIDGKKGKDDSIDGNVGEASGFRRSLAYEDLAEMATRSIAYEDLSEEVAYDDIDIAEVTTPLNC